MIIYNLYYHFIIPKNNENFREDHYHNNGNNNNRINTIPLNNYFDTIFGNNRISTKRTINNPLNLERRYYLMKKTIEKK